MEDEDIPPVQVSGMIELIIEQLVQHSLHCDLCAFGERTCQEQQRLAKLHRKWQRRVQQQDMQR